MVWWVKPSWVTIYIIYAPVCTADTHRNCLTFTGLTLTTRVPGQLLSHCRSLQLWIGWHSRHRSGATLSLCFLDTSFASATNLPYFPLGSRVVVGEIHRNAQSAVNLVLSYAQTRITIDFPPLLQCFSNYIRLPAGWINLISFVLFLCNRVKRNLSVLGPFLWGDSSPQRFVIEWLRPWRPWCYSLWAYCSGKQVSDGNSNKWRSLVSCAQWRVKLTRCMQARC